MNRFFVGQRVRILWSENWPELSGEEGVIQARNHDGGMEGVSEWQVSPVIWGSTRAPRVGLRAGLRFAPNSRQLEPILPEGAAPSEFSYSELMDKLRSGVAA